MREKRKMRVKNGYALKLFYSFGYGGGYTAKLYLLTTASQKRWVIRRDYSKYDDATLVFAYRISDNTNSKEEIIKYARSPLRYDGKISVDEMIELEPEDYDFNPKVSDALQRIYQIEV